MKSAWLPQDIDKAEAGAELPELPELPNADLPGAEPDLEIVRPLELEKRIEPSEPKIDFYGGRARMMERKTFENLMMMAKTMQRLERSDYWSGYQRGLRRAFHGESFGTADEHETWLNLATIGSSLATAIATV